MAGGPASTKAERAEQGMNSAAACALKFIKNDFSSFSFFLSIEVGSRSESL
jgi:hypothetical protein